MAATSGDRTIRYDALVRAAFRRDQRRDKGFGPALGIDAHPSHCGLAARGFATASAPSDWHIPRTALAHAARTDRRHRDAARSAGRHTPPHHDWQEARLRQALRGRLAITIGHRDILAPAHREDDAMLLGAIADDFTGATDLCSMLVRGGMRTVQLIGVPRPGRSGARRRCRRRRAEVAHRAGAAGGR